MSAPTNKRKKSKKIPTSIGMNLRVTGHCNQGGRKYMEDFFGIACQQSPNEKDFEYAFFGIYDGHGGYEAANFAKDHLMNAIVSQKLFWSNSDEDILRAIRDGYITTHYNMWREQEKWPKTASGLPSTAGTTASVAFIRREKIYIGHVGDSGIVLGYQEDNDKKWKAKQLTKDHKPECNDEKTRIINSGGKVVTKSGVPRVVWNRPRIGHKGPVRRSTPFDEIPFLAVARSLGDLWSYNSALNVFVVSPLPDVKVVTIDPKSYKCLIFGTDGLWNVLSPEEAVEIAQETELKNEQVSLAEGQNNEWNNPSKTLVGKALEKWSIKKMRADNTSVVTVMLYPPGQSKHKFGKRSKNSHSREYFQVEDMEGQNVEANVYQHFLTPEAKEVSSISSEKLDTSTIQCHPHDSIEILGHETPTLIQSAKSGYPFMTKYESNCDNNYLHYENQNDMMLPISTSTTSFASSPSLMTTDLTIRELYPSTPSLQLDSFENCSLTNGLQYTNSFAESYNSLLISSYENETSNDCNSYMDYENDGLSDDSNGEVLNQHHSLMNRNTNEQDESFRSNYHSYHNLDEVNITGHNHLHHQLPNNISQEEQHQYQQQCMSTEEGYSLTKLETRCEQQYRTVLTPYSFSSLMRYTSLNIPQPVQGHSFQMSCNDEGTMVNNEYDNSYHSSAYNQSLISGGSNRDYVMNVHVNNTRKVETIENTHEVGNVFNNTKITPMQNDVIPYRNNDSTNSGETVSPNVDRPKIITILSKRHYDENVTCEKVKTVLNTNTMEKCSINESVAINNCDSVEKGVQIHEISSSSVLETPPLNIDDTDDVEDIIEEDEEEGTVEIELDQGLGIESEENCDKILEIEMKCIETEDDCKDSSGERKESRTIVAEIVKVETPVKRNTRSKISLVQQEQEEKQQRHQKCNKGGNPGSKSKNAMIKPSPSKINSQKFRFEQNENISFTIYPEGRYLRSSAEYNKRTLRSRNSLCKDMKAKPQQRQQQLRRAVITNFTRNAKELCNRLRPRYLQQQGTQERKETQSQITVWNPRNGRKHTTTKNNSCANSPSIPFLNPSNTRQRQQQQSILHNNNNNNNNRPKGTLSNNNLINAINTKVQSKTLLSSPSSSSIVSSTTSSPSSSSSISRRSFASRNSAWCPGKSSVQTRNRVQKRISH